MPTADLQPTLLRSGDRVTVLVVAFLGRVTSLVFLLGMTAMLFAPDTGKRNMGE